ncbi:MAG: histidine ammonia-lyase [Caldisericia bacterium]|nr:histidine ammonia-lyase [Caldisericia bacterium]MDD4614736.1 histidine ammonia-lyase [Caldisericia bacterium]
MSILLDGHSLSLDTIVSVACKREKVSIHPDAFDRIQQSRDYVGRILESNKVVYGINTGFGKLSSTPINESQLSHLQVNLIRSHAVGVGKPLPEELVRATILIRVNSLLIGYSGIRKELIDALIDVLNHEIYPFIPSKGSLGASGDLAPLAHLALVLMGEGECFQNDEKIPSRFVLRDHGLKPILLEPKEGLALINGTSMSTAMLSLNLIHILHLLDSAFCSIVLSLEAFCGCKAAFSSLVHQQKPHQGQQLAGKILETSIYDSKLLDSSSRVQDPYSFRCVPQVLGPVIDTIRYCLQVNHAEMNSATDNPLLFVEEDQVISGGNFHAQPIAIAADYLSIALQTLGEISQHRVNQLLDPNLSGGIPAFGVKEPGLNSGFMIVQYTDAALVSQNKTLTYPATSTSIPVSANQEDFVSMAPTACSKLHTIVWNTSRIIGIELLTAFQCLEFRDRNKMGSVAKKIYDLVSSQFEPVLIDRSIHKEMETMGDQILKGMFQDILPIEIIL